MLIIGKTYKLKPKSLLGIEEDDCIDPKTKLYYPGMKDPVNIITITGENNDGTFTFETQNEGTLYSHASWVFHKILKEL